MNWSPKEQYNKSMKEKLVLWKNKQDSGEKAASWTNGSGIKVLNVSYEMVNYSRKK
jgi:hypothetical protein